MLLAAGCASRPTLCGNAVFFFVEGDMRKIEANFRDDRLLKTDVVVRGSIQEWLPGPLWKVQPYFTCSLELESSAPVENLELSVEDGSPGDGRYAKVPLFRSGSFVGKARLPDFEVGGLVPSASLILSFGKKDDPKVRELEIKELLKKEPIQSSTAQRP
jgi:hypothetical protein